MNSYLSRCLACALGFAFSFSVWAVEDKPKEMLSLDDQVQQIKSDVLEISAELALLEEQLLFPATTQMALFVALTPDDEFRLDALHLNLNGELATHYIYSFDELDALRRGGVHRVYDANLARGQHQLEVEVVGKTRAGKTVTHSHSYTFSKGVEPAMLGLTLGGSDGAVAELTDW
jgi:hypothetical protein